MDGDVPGEHIHLVVVGIGHVHEVTINRDLSGMRESTVRTAEDRDDVEGTVQDHHTVVARVGHVDAAFGIDRDALGMIETAVDVAFGRVVDPVGRGNDLDPVVVRVGDQQPPRDRVDRDALWFSICPQFEPLEPYVPIACRVATSYATIRSF